jgi:mannose-6-phosphate isomerase-like protein (cupin superfamily)
VTYNVVHLDELESIPVGDRGLQWRPIRSRLGIRAFGTNAYTANVGAEIVEEHTERTYGHEEMYVVVRGRATFTLDGADIDAPAGTIVHVPDPSVRRTAVAREPETTVLAVGGKPGEAFEPSAWELGFQASQMEPREAVAYVEQHMGEYPESPATHYNLACFRALAGDRDGAIDALARAAELDSESVQKWAEGDSDLDSIRNDARVASLLETS